MPVCGVHQGTLAALHHARRLSDDITAVHVLIDPDEAWGGGVRMVMLNSPYRLLLEPLLEYVTDIARQRQPGETLTIVVLEFVSSNRLAVPLHMNTAELLRNQLKRQHGIVINVPHHVHDGTDTRQALYVFQSIELLGDLYFSSWTE